VTGPNTRSNAGQVAEWNGESGQHWATYQDRYDAMLRPLGDRLIAAARITPIDRILDVGCGCGASTLRAAAAASQGTALGLDLSAPMLERARSAAGGMPNVRFEQADAQVYDFTEGAFDLVLSQFGVMFFAEPVTAFGNLLRALRPGGRMVFLCWPQPISSDFRTVTRNVIASFIRLPEQAPTTAPGSLSLAEPDHVRGLLDRAGYSDVRIEPLTEPVPLGPDAPDAARFLAGRPLMQQVMASTDDATRAKIIDALTDVLTGYQTPAGVILHSAAWLVTARRP
jgi:SAM-dependent methyltransferase